MRSARLLVAGMLALIVIGAVAGCGQLTLATQRSAPASVQQTSLPAVHIWMIVDRWMYTEPEQFCDAPLVVEVVVGAHGEARWNTSDGKRPTLATSGEIVRAGDFIYAPVAFSSFTALRVHGLAPGAAYVTIGGQVGQDSYRIDGEPQPPDTGGHYIVVVSPPRTPKYLNSPNILLIAYTYPIDASGKVTIQRAGDPNEPGVGPVQPEIAVALPDLKATLAQCAA